MSDQKELPEQPKSAEAEVRDSKTGRFLPGNNAHNRYVVERKKERAAPILAAITEEFSHDEIRLMMRRAWEVAETAEDAKSMLEIIRFIAAYAIGKPVTRSIGVQFGKSDLLDLFGRRDEGGDDDDTIDIE
jgi:hypothetical protein